MISVKSEEQLGRDLQQSQRKMVALGAGLLLAGVGLIAVEWRGRS